MTQIWDFPEAEHAARDLVGFEVRTVDGSLGQVERQETEPGRQHLVVDTGVWLFGTSVLVPVGAVATIEPEEHRVTLAFTKDEIKGAPRFTADRETHEPGYLAAVGSYYRDVAEARRSTVA